MKRVFFVFLAVFFSAGLSLQAQNWSLPQDNKPKNTITWATPAEMTLSFDYPFKGTVEYYDIMERKSKDAKTELEHTH